MREYKGKRAGRPLHVTLKPLRITLSAPHFIPGLPHVIPGLPHVILSIHHVILSEVEGSKGRGNGGYYRTDGRFFAALRMTDRRGSVSLSPCEYRTR